MGKKRVGAVVALLLLCTVFDSNPGAAQPTGQVLNGKPAFGDWRADGPGVTRHIRPADLPPPDQAHSVDNEVRVVRRPQGARLSVPPGFSAALFASGLTSPRLLRTAPNGDVFVAETRAGRIKVLHAAGAGAEPSQTIFASRLDQPFGIAFYPVGRDPTWVYVANRGSVVRFPYRNGDLKAGGKPEVLVPHLPSGRGHSTRDIAFSNDGSRMFVSVGSASNAGESLRRLSTDELRRWKDQHSLGAAWEVEEGRADVLVFDPDGRNRRVFATGIRNCVGMAVHPGTGDLWCSTNERDDLGDNTPPDYVTRVREGAFYGWPWFYIGANEDPRLTNARPELKNSVTVPDVLIQAHSASMQIAFNKGDQFPDSFKGDLFAAEHGSWNRSKRTGYKVVRVKLRDGVPTGEYEDFVTGFVVSDDSVWGRPVGIAFMKDGSMLLSEDANGTIWRVSHDN
jgi:glucose/arabinose dehydrogenase